MKQLKNVVFIYLIQLKIFSNNFKRNKIILTHGIIYNVINLLYNFF